MSKLATIYKLAIDPGAYPFLWREARSRILGRTSSLEKSEQQAISWCKPRAIAKTDLATALLAGQSIVKICDVFPAEFAFANGAEQMSDPDGRCW